MAHNKPASSQCDRAGAFTFALHSHLPYCRMAGQWPHGEEWLHEALAETYVPLLSTLYDLWEQGVHFKLTLGVTPVLAEQLADSDVCAHFLVFLDHGEGVVPVPRLQHVVAKVGHGIDDEAANEKIIVDHQDRLAAAWQFFAARRFRRGRRSLPVRARQEHRDTGAPSRG